MFDPGKFGHPTSGVCGTIPFHAALARETQQPIKDKRACKILRI